MVLYSIFRIKRTLSFSFAESPFYKFPSYTHEFLLESGKMKENLDCVIYLTSSFLQSRFSLHLIEGISKALTIPHSVLPGTDWQE